MPDYAMFPREKRGRGRIVKAVASPILRFVASIINVFVSRPRGFGRCAISETPNLQGNGLDRRIYRSVNWKSGIRKDRRRLRHKLFRREFYPRSFFSPRLRLFTHAHITVANPRL